MNKSLQYDVIIYAIKNKLYDNNKKSGKKRTA